MTNEAKASIDRLFNEPFELPTMVRVAHGFQERPLRMTAPQAAKTD